MLRTLDLLGHKILSGYSTLSSQAISHVNMESMSNISISIIGIDVELCLIFRDADKSPAIPISCLPICSTTKIIFLGWVKVRTTKSQVCGAQGEYVQTFFQSIPSFLYKAKDLSAPCLVVQRLTVMVDQQT
jgi:hypothetical protein